MNLAQTAPKTVRIIAPTITGGLNKRAIELQINTAAYARVSTLKEEQEQSYERQVSHYTQYIKANPAWRFVKVYSDEGTGTRADKRTGFLEMIADCRAGKIDKILCKGVSRFARSTVDALKYIHELKDLGVSVFFENENIDTLTPGGEILLTILAGMAEQESRTISANVKWAYQKKFEDGGIILHTERVLGYTKDSSNNIIIDPQQAVIVQRIFKEFLVGYSTKAIAERLDADGIKTPRSSPRWVGNTCLNIIKNIQYTGDVIMGKSYKADVLSKSRRRNNGERPLYFIENAIPAIISKETYELAQAEYKRRTSLRSHSKSGKGRYSCLYAFSGFLFCGHCGAKLRKFHQRGKGGAEVTVWWCTHKERFGRDACTQKMIKDDGIKTAFINLINGHIAGEGLEFIRTLHKNIVAELNDDYLTDLDGVDEKIKAVQAEALRINKENRLGVLSNADYDEQIDRLEKELNGLREQKSQMILKNERVKLAEFRLQEIERILGGGEVVEFDTDLFRNLIEKIVVDGEQATFHLIAGAEIEVPLPKAA